MGVPKIKILLWAVSLLLWWGIASPMPVYASSGIQVVLDGEIIQWEDVTPYFQNGRVTVPIAKLCEALGAPFTWNAGAQEIFIYLNDRYVWLQLGNPTLYHGTYAINAQGAALLTGVTAQPLDVSPLIHKGRVTAPLGALITALGGTVTAWDAQAQTAYVVSPPFKPVPSWPSRYEEDILSAVEAEPAAPAGEGGYFHIINMEQVITKYEADEPYVLLCFDSVSASMKDTLQAAADLQLKIYGLDTSDEKTAGLPFRQTDEFTDTCVYLITEYGQVTELQTPDYETVRAALLDYWGME